MKKTKLTVLCAIMSGSLLFSSCIGSFGLWSKLKDWNQGLGNKFVNEIVFWLSTSFRCTKLLILPMYWF